MKTINAKWAISNYQLTVKENRILSSAGMTNTQNHCSIVNDQLIIIN